jgi:hypothetical protein
MSCVTFRVHTPLQVPESAESKSAASAQPGCWRPGIVVIGQLLRLQLAHARPALVYDEEGDDVVARQPLGHALDVLGERRRDVGLALAGQLHALVSGGVRVDPAVVKKLRERAARLLDRLALVWASVERGNQVGQVLNGHGIQPSISEAWRELKDAPERGAVHVLRAALDIDTRRPPLLGRLGQRRRSALLGLDQVEQGHAPGRQLAVDVPLAGQSLGSGREGAAVQVRGLAAAESEADAVTLAAAARRPGDDPRAGPIRSSTWQTAQRCRPDRSRWITSPTVEYGSWPKLTGILGARRSFVRYVRLDMPCSSRTGP